MSWNEQNASWTDFTVILGTVGVGKGEQSDSKRCTTPSTPCESIDWKGWTACSERAEERSGVGTDGGRQRGHFTPASLPPWNTSIHVIQAVRNIWCVAGRQQKSTFDGINGETAGLRILLSFIHVSLNLALLPSRSKNYIYKHIKNIKLNS